ncbi:helix-turn-helix domain-containing protein [Tundrisphaera sp. TA3]|uniref:cobalamin B12-binding domain-containing protein n=1 Tax=Tundrisphaera sp. TA3 TaxID=3435775 RepID=UPI003EB6F596
MSDSDALLKTGQVAEVLGVSVSTAKRWIDSGQIQGTRTVGKHRLIPMSSVVRFAQRGTFPLDRLAPPAPVAAADESPDALCRRLYSDLKAGDAPRATSLITSAYASMGAAMLGDALIRPVMEQAGHAWMVGDWEIYHEHRASRIVSTAIRTLIAGLPTGESGRPIAAGSAPEGDIYELPGLLAELTLREGGWDVHNLGVDLPLRSLAAAVRDLKPRLAFLTISHLPRPDHFVQEYAYFYEAAVRADTAIILGGRACDPAIRPRLIYASCGERMTHLAEFARRLHGVPGC